MTSLASHPGLPAHLPSYSLPPAPALSSEDLLTPSLPLTTSLLGLLGELAYPNHPWLSSCLSLSLLRSVPTYSSSCHLSPPGPAWELLQSLPCPACWVSGGREGQAGLPWPASGIWH